MHSIWKQHGLATSYDRLEARRPPRGARPTRSSARLRRATISRRVIARAGANGSSSHPRREELLATAAKVFSARGYEGASLREICAAAGILPGSMYHHFSSKEDLFVSVHARRLPPPERGGRPALEGESEPGRGSRRRSARTWPSWSSAATWSRSPPPACSIWKARTCSGASTASARPTRTRFRKLIQALPLPADVDRSLLRLTLLGAVNWTRVWYRPGKRSPAQIAHHLVQKVLRKSLG